MLLSFVTCFGVDTIFVYRQLVGGLVASDDKGSESE